MNEKAILAELYSEIARRAALDFPTYGHAPHPEDVAGHVITALEGAVLLLTILRERGVELK